MLRQVLISTPPPADLADIQEFVYPPSAPALNIIKVEIIKVMMNLNLKKAPGPDNVPNKILRDLLPEPLPAIHCLFSAS